MLADFGNAISFVINTRYCQLPEDEAKLRKACIEYLVAATQHAKNELAKVPPVAGLTNGPTN